MYADDFRDLFRSLAVIVQGFDPDPVGLAQVFESSHGFTSSIQK
jgi:hypothetical protein